MLKFILVALLVFGGIAIGASIQDSTISHDAFVIIATIYVVSGATVISVMK